MQQGRNKTNQKHGTSAWKKTLCLLVLLSARLHDQSGKNVVDLDYLACTSYCWKCIRGMVIGYARNKGSLVLGYVMEMPNEYPQETLFFRCKKCIYLTIKK